MKALRILGFVVLLGFLVGCASVGRPIDPDKLAQVVRGKSTMSDVVALLGEPQNVAEVDGPTGKHTDMHYLYSYAAADGKNFIPYYGSFVQEYHTKSQDVTITLNAAGVVESISKNFGGISSKAGVAAEQPKAKQTTQAAATLPPPPLPASHLATQGPMKKQQPAADTPRQPVPSRPLREQFKQVSVGMSQARVVALLGEPSERSDVIWKWSQKGAAGQAWVGFTNGKVAMSSWQESR